MFNIGVQYFTVNKVLISPQCLAYARLQSEGRSLHEDIHFKKQTTLELPFLHCNEKETVYAFASMILFYYFRAKIGTVAFHKYFQE